MKIYNPNLSPSIVNELNRLDSRYFQFDAPIPFKDGLMIYPVSVKNHDEFLTASACLTLNRMESAEGITTSNLGYLLLKMNDKKNPDEAAAYSQYFIRICEMIFHINYGIKCNKCGKVYNYSEFLLKFTNENNSVKCECGNVDGYDVNIKYKLNEETKKYEIIIDDVHITEKDFDLLRQIVMYQNLPDYKDDSWVDPDVRQDQREKQELLSKKNKIGNATLERKIVCVSAKTCYTIKELYDLTMRKFLMLLSAVDDTMNYECNRIGLMTGMVSSKEPIEHWIYKQDAADLYGKATDAGEFTNKVSGKQNI